jgi:ribokinase
MDPACDVLVVGSINMDLAVRTQRMPLPGQTVLGHGFATTGGGKGANQAVAVARMGGQAVLLGRVGDDEFGRALLASLQASGVNTQCVLATHQAHTGVALIMVDAKGENSIVVASGANFSVTPDDLFHCERLFAGAKIVLLQLELPLPTVLAARRLARKHGCRVVLDPAPAQPNLPAELLDADIISPNVGEAEIITDHKCDATEERLGKYIATELIARGAKGVALKLGARGSVVMTADGIIRPIKPYKVNVVDTTAAGDAFTGALALYLARGLPLHKAARYANAAGALACTRFGAQSAMPGIGEVEMLMADQKD